MLYVVLFLMWAQPYPMVQALPSLEPVGNFYHEKDPHDYTVHAFKRQL